MSEARYSAEVKVVLEGRECSISASRDTLQEIFQDIRTICSQFPQAAQMNRKDAAAAPAKAKEMGEIPVCEQCSSSEFMELIEFTDKKTGKPRKAWKCQQCGGWHWPNGKKERGR
jgi:rubrerythrin